MSRADAFFNDTQQFNQTLFDEFVDFSNRYGDGYYNLTVAAEYRYHRIQQSIATNPTFSYIFPRFFMGYGESVIPLNLFVDGRQNATVLGGARIDMATAQSFFRDHKFPIEFHRANAPAANTGAQEIMAARPIQPCQNEGGKVDNCVVHELTPDNVGPCGIYHHFIDTAVSLYPNPKGVLKRNLKLNMHYYHSVFEQACEERFPYGPSSAKRSKQYNGIIFRTWKYMPYLGLYPIQGTSGHVGEKSSLAIQAGTILPSQYMAEVQYIHIAF
ncbi:heme-thiolate peroxidase, partial [Candolleomyces efflorescens]